MATGLDETLGAERIGGRRSATVGVLAPTGRDGPLAVRVLSLWQIEAQSYSSMDALLLAMRSDLAAAILAEEALTPAALDALHRELGAHPGWSDLPLIVLTVPRESGPGLPRSIATITERSNMTLLERPVRMATLVTTVRSALRARARQYDVRDHLADVVKARAAAEAANQAKVDFLAMMSHELRTPLNAIGGYAELLEMGIRGAINDAQRADLGRIQRSQRHLLSLINGLLTFARVERGNIEYSLTAVSIGDLATAVEPLVAPQGRARGLALDFSDCPQDIYVIADREKLEQILLNLLGNAIKFTETGGRVALSCEQHGAKVVIVVSDTGVGIPAEKLALIFDPFVQLDSRLTRVSEGVGLGLAISRDLAKGMGGDLTATSEVGVGSRFTLTLPAASHRD